MVSNNDNDAGSAISANFITGAPAPQGSDVRLRWLYSRTYFDEESADYNVVVTQESGGLTSVTGNLNLVGSGFTLDSDRVDVGKLGSLRMVSADLDMSGYDPQSSLQFTNNNNNQTFKIRRTHLQYRSIGRMRKSKAGVS